MNTVVFIILILVLALGWEFYTLGKKDLRTISKAMQEMGHEWSPFVVSALSVLVGHFWISPPDHLTLAQHLGEWVEVGTVVGLEIIVFGVFRFHRNVLPLSWWQNTLLIAASVLVGAFVWTIGA